MKLRTLKRRTVSHLARGCALRWEMRRWSQIMLRLSPRVSLRPELLD